jgi:tetratricopeptide (TPR) repeat protein
MNIASLIRAALLVCMVTMPLMSANAQDDLSESISVLEQAVAANPADLGARLRLAGLYETAGRLDQAIEQYQAVVDQTEPSTKEGEEARRQMRYAVATRYAQQGDLDHALPIFEDLAKEYPDNPVILYSIGVAHLLRGQMDDARAALEKVIEIDPRYINAYLNLASVDEAQDRRADAVAKLQKVMDIAPATPAARQAEVRLSIIEGQILSDQGNLSDAIAAFQRAIEMDPKNHVALTSLVDLYRRSGNEDAEFATLKDVVSAYPDDWGMRLRLAVLYASVERYREAYEQLEPLLDLGFENPFTVRAKQIYTRIKDTDAVRKIEEEKYGARVSALKAWLHEHPDDVAAWKDLGLLQRGHGGFSEAEKAFSQAKRLDPNDLQSRYALADIYDNLGRFPESVDEYATLISMERNDKITERLVSALQLVNAKNLYVQGKFPQAIREFEQILSSHPDNEIAHFYLGLIYSREEETARAVDAYREVIRLAPGNISAHLNLAASYALLNREEDAVDEYNKILQANPPPAVADSARRGLIAAQRRLQGFSFNAGYLMSYDDNTNLSHSAPVGDLRSDLSFNLAYQYKMENNLRWRFLFAPVYSTYHDQGFDFLNTTTTLSAEISPGSYTLVGGLTNRISNGLVSNSRLGRMNMLFADASTRVRLPALFRPLGQRRVMSALAFNASYSDFDAKASPFSSAYTAALGAMISQPASERATWRAGYQVIMNSNKELVGNDYAYRGNEISLGLDYAMPWGALNAGYSLGWYDYSRADSFTNFTRHRRNVRNNLALGASYRWKRDISLFGTLSWTRNKSNLPVGLVLSSQDVIEALQSSSLGDYDRVMVTVGANMNF